MPALSILEKIFGSTAKVKILRLFLFHPSTPFDAAMVREKTNARANKVRKILNDLEKIDLIKKKTFEKQGKVRKKKSKGWVLNQSFEYLKPLQIILIGMNPMKHDDISERFKGMGRIKALVVSGVFIQDSESRIDILIVGDKLKVKAIKQAIKAMEAEIGKELRYSIFDTEEFSYRLKMYDKLVRDILDFPHETVLDKIKLSTEKK